MRNSPSLGGLSSRVDEFSPLSLPNLVLWLRGDMGITSSGGAVSTWADQSPQGNTVNQSNSPQRPTVTTLAGQPAVKFDAASNQLLENLSPTGLVSTAQSLFLVAAPQNFLTDGGFYVNVGDNVFGNVRNLNDGIGNWGVYSNGNVSSGQLQTLNQPSLFEWIQGSSQLSFWKNGIAGNVVANSPGAYSSPHIVLGEYYNLTSFPEGCAIAEVIVCAAVLTPTLRIAVENYLLARYPGLG